jgi:hypothetical protein
MVTTYNDSLFLKSTLKVDQSAANYYFKKTKTLYRAEDIFYKPELYVAAFNDAEINEIIVTLLDHHEWTIEFSFANSLGWLITFYSKDTKICLSGKSELEVKIKLLQKLHLKNFFKLKPHTHGKGKKTSAGRSTGTKK